MKYWKATLAILVLLSASVALAEDFKTVSGKVYKDATVSRVEADGIVLRTKTGISKVYFVELPKDVQERFHYRSAMPTVPTGKAVTRRIDAAESARPAATQYVDAADRFAQRVEKTLGERESILQGKHTPGPAERRSYVNLPSIKLSWLGLLSLPSSCSLSFGIVLNNKQ